MSSFNYNAAAFSQAILYAERMETQMEDAKSQALGILGSLNPPSDLDISGEVASLKSQIEALSSRAVEVSSTVASLRSQIEATDASIASQISYFLRNELNYIDATEKERYVGSKPDPRNYADGINDSQYEKDLKEYNLKMAAYEAFKEGKIDYNYLKSEYGEEVAKEVQNMYSKLTTGWQEGDGKSIIEGLSDVKDKVADIGKQAVTWAIAWNTSGITGKAQLLKSALSTVVEVDTALVKSAANIVEGVVDSVALVGGGLLGLTTGLVSDETGDAILNNTKGFISTDWTGKGYEAFYDTTLGKTLDSNSIWTHDSPVMTTITGLGETALTIGLMAINPVFGATVAGSQTMGETAEKDFKNGGEFLETAAHSTLSGLFEGAMWYTGAKVNLGGDLVISVADPLIRSGIGMIAPNETRSYSDIFNQDYGGVGGIIANIGFSIVGNALFDRLANTKYYDSIIKETEISMTKKADSLADRLEFYINGVGMANDVYSAMFWHYYAVKDELLKKPKKLFSVTHNILDTLDYLEHHLDEYMSYQHVRQSLLRKALNTPTLYYPECNLISTVNILKASGSYVKKPENILKKFIDKYNFNLSKDIDLKKSTIFVSDVDFNRMINNKNWGAFNTVVDGDSYNVIPITNYKDISTIIHEAIHEISSKGYISGLLTKEEFRGINEGMTQLLAEKAFKFVPRNGYREITDFFDRVSTLIDIDTKRYKDQEGIKVLGDAYFNHDNDEIYNILYYLTGSKEASESMYNELLDNSNIIAHGVDPKNDIDSETIEHAIENMEKMADNIEDLYRKNVN